MKNQYLKGITIGDTPYIAVPVAYLAQLLNAAYGDANLARLADDELIYNELVYSIEDYLGCTLDSPGISPAALDEAAAMNAYDLMDGERQYD